MRTVLSFDLGATSACVLQLDEGVEAHELHTFEPDPGWDRISPDRCAAFDVWARTQLLRLPDFVAFEQPRGGHPGSMAWISAQIGILMVACRDEGVPVFGFNVTSVKSHATGKGNAGKLLMREAMGKVAGVALSNMALTVDAYHDNRNSKAWASKLSDLVDAYWIGRLALATVEVTEE